MADPPSAISGSEPTGHALDIRESGIVMPPAFVQRLPP
jgi:hypothetical protein